MAFRSDNRREKFGWCLYDWANSAFATTVMAAILPVYFAGAIVPEGGVLFSLMGRRVYVSATSLWGYASGLTAFLVLISAPFLGGIADQSNRKKTFLSIFCYSGSLMTLLFFFSGPGDVFYTLILFCLAHYCFVGGNVFYDAFLPFISPGRDMDRLSGQGYALGYLGGGILLALNVVIVSSSQRTGLFHETTAIRLCLASAGIWWALFGSISFSLFQEHGVPRFRDTGLLKGAVAGWRRVWETTLSITRQRHVLIFLASYMIYNDGIQTVIKMASIYGKEELNLSTGTLLGALLMVQCVGIGGSLLMSSVARLFGTKRTIMGGLVAWFGLTLFSYRMETPSEYWVMALVVGLILGGTQALSRSFYGRIIPKEQSAEFFGYFSVFGKFSAIWGPIIFAVVRQVTGTSRLSILSLSLFFFTGWVLLLFVREERPEPSPETRRGL